MHTLLYKMLSCIVTFSLSHFEKNEFRCFQQNFAQRFQQSRALPKIASFVFSISRTLTNSAYQSRREIQLLQFWVFNISFEPKFGNPSFDTPEICNLFVTSKIEFSNPPILYFSNLKCCIKAKEPYKTPF